MASQPPKTKVIVVGAGIAGPVLATFLKLKGYDPVVYERTSGVGDKGLGHGISSEGLKVLAKIPGLIDNLEHTEVAKIIAYSTVEQDKRLLLESPLPAPAPGGYRNFLVRRATLHKLIVDVATQHGVPIHWGCKVEDVVQGEGEDGESVTVKFEGGGEDTGSFVVGADGLHSNVRSALFGDERASYTGLVQTGGVAPIPESFKGSGILLNVYGNGAHVIAGAVNSTQVFWALTQREPETAKESWNAVDNRIADEIRASPVASWDFGVGELIKSTETFTKYGLYDRPELQTWHKGRVILIGDAAHPTSPHLGQGATQAFEDIDKLIEVLSKYNPTASSPPTSVLSQAFSELETQRIPRSSAMVKGARRQGEARVVKGVEACLERNRKYVEIFRDAVATRAFRASAE